MQTAKTALITGGAKRIGSALVKALHKQGLNIVFQYNRSAIEAEQILLELNQNRPNSVIGLGTDLQATSSYQELVDNAIDHFGRLDVLINNAAGFFSTPLQQASQENWNELMDVNAKAPFFLAKSCYQSLKQNQGCIINITDVYADRPLPDYPIYCASKAALTSLTFSLAQSFSPQVRVNAIAPGAILPAENGGVETMKAVIERTPLKRLGGTEAIVETALFLINDASFITGQVINVDGGRTIVNA